jgi:hypothetical protein
MITKWIPIIIVFLMFSCCPENKPDRKEIKYYAIKNNGRKTDTVFLKELNKSSVLRLQLLYTAEFSDIKPIKKYSNDPAPLDGRFLSYYCDDFGVFYSVNTTWRSYYRLRCTNDSIDDIISNYVDHIISDEKLTESGIIEEVVRPD